MCEMMKPDDWKGNKYFCMLRCVKMVELCKFILLLLNFKKSIACIVTKDSGMSTPEREWLRAEQEWLEQEFERLLRRYCPVYVEQHAGVTDPRAPLDHMDSVWDEADEALHAEFSFARFMQSLRQRK